MVGRSGLRLLAGPGARAKGTAAWAVIDAMTTAALPAESIASGGSAVVGPFIWTPQFRDQECMLMIASADGDLPNTDPATELPCANRNAPSRPSRVKTQRNPGHLPAASFLANL